VSTFLTSPRFLAALSFLPLLSLLSSAAAFSPVAFVARPSALNANIIDTATEMKGPHFCWGSNDEDKPENEIKGYDGFETFLKAVADCGLTDTLKSGEFTVFAPTNSAWESSPELLADKGKLADVLKYHCVPKKIASGAISGDLETVNGKSLTYTRKFRKTFMDLAIIGQEDNFGGGSKFPIDVECDNGVLHAIATVLDPSYEVLSAEAGSTLDHA